MVGASCILDCCQARYYTHIVAKRKFRKIAVLHSNNNIADSPLKFWELLNNTDKLKKGVNNVSAVVNVNIYNSDKMEEKRGQCGTQR